MPKVGRKEFPYSDRGVKAAKEESKKSGEPVKHKPKKDRYGRREI